MNKKASKIRRAKRTRAHIQRLRMPRLCVHKTPRHIYVQLISACGKNTLASASTVDKSLKAKLKITGNVEAAKTIGQLIAERAIKAGVKAVAFDRSGYKFHGRVKALADAAREGGLEF